MSFIFKIIILAVVFLGLNLLAQRIFPTKQGDPFGQRVLYRFLVYALFIAVVGIVVIASGR